MSAQNPQVVDSQEFIDILDYEFLGDSYTQERKRALVDAYREHGSILHAAQAIRVSRKTVYNWIDADPQFAEAVADVKEDNVEELETSVYKRAFTNDLLAMFYLKAHRPKFRDRVSIDVEVVRTEIEQRMQQLNLKQLPVGVTEFIPASQSLIEQDQNIPQTTESLQFSPPSAQTQKEESEHNPALDE